MLNLLYNRRSIRKFKPAAVEEQKIETMIQSLLLSPSGKNKKPWRFILITDPDIIAATSGCKPHGAAALKSAPLVIAVIADTEGSDVWIEDCSIASIIVQLTAESIGLSSCWVQIRQRMTADGGSSGDYLREPLKLKNNETVESLIAAGYADEILPAYKKTDLDFTKIERL